MAVQFINDIIVKGTVSLSVGTESMASLTPIFEGLEIRVSDGVNPSTLPIVTIKDDANGGNVGIGTTSLTSISSTSRTLSLGSTSTTTSGGIAFQVNGVVKAYNYVSNGYLYNQTVAGIGQIFFGAGSERMRIHSSTGNVGIGTTNPQSKLDVNGIISLGGTQFAEYIANSDLFIIGDIDGAGAELALNTDSGEAVRIDLLGNVGIGTTSPAALLSLAQPISGDTTMLLGRRNGKASIKSDTTEGGYLILDSHANAVALNHYSSNNVWLVTGGGNVGIGATSPSEKLHVRGSSFIQSTTGSDGNLNIKTNITGTLQSGYANVGAGDLVIGGHGTTSQFPAVMTLINQDGSISANEDLGVIQFGGKDDNTTGYCNAQIIGTSAGNAGSGSSGGGILRFLTATTATADTPNERMRIDKDGNVGIGTTSPVAKLDVNGDIRLKSDNQIYFGGAGSIPYWNVGVQNTTTNNFEIAGVSYYSGDRDILLNPSSNGNVGIGTTSPSAKLHITIPQYNTGCRMDGPTGTVSYGYMSFYSGTSYRGAISTTSTGVNYASASDYRLKENVTKLQNSTEKIKKLKPSNFNFLENPSETVDGFIAHELQEIVPEAVTGEKDAVGLDGKPSYQGVDQSKIVPLLTAALQEAISKIEQLETRIQTLENK